MQAGKQEECTSFCDRAVNTKRFAFVLGWRKVERRPKPFFFEAKEGTGGGEEEEQEPVSVFLFYQQGFQSKKKTVSSQQQKIQNSFFFVFFLGWKKKITKKKKFEAFRNRDLDDSPVDNARRWVCDAILAPLLNCVKKIKKN